MPEKIPKNAPIFNFLKEEEIPFVTIQLPVYNELYVMDRLLDNIAEIDYPKDKLEIQVLDDSTDESFEETAKHIQELQKTGLDIQHVTRENREGFKAGALKEGLKMPKANTLQFLMQIFFRRKIG